MLTCCVSGCENRYFPGSRIKFYTIPSGSRHFQVKRRRLWIEAIVRVNGSTAGLKAHSRICGAHFISGEASMDHDRPDYVPSVFTCVKEKPKKKMKRSYSCRQSLPRKAKADTAGETTPPESDGADLQTSDVLETADELSEQTPSPPPLQKNIRELTEEADSKTNTIPLETTSSPNKASASPTSAVGIQQMDKMNPVVLLKTVIAPAGGYQCEQCSQTFISVSEFIKHKQLHEEEKACVSDQEDVAETQTVPMDEPSFPCNMCDRSFPTSQNLKRHKLLHVKDGRKCSKCGVLFCRLHNHVVFLPQAESKTESDEESSSSEEEEQDVDTSPEKTLPESVEPQQMAEAVNTESSQDLTLPASSSPSAPSPNVPPLPPLANIPGLESVKPSPMPCLPSPILRFGNNPKIMFRFKSQVPDYPSTFVQPHLPQQPELPSSLRMFSPQCLTSCMLKVKRDYEFILSQRSNDDIKNVVKEEPNEVLIVPPEVKPVKVVKIEKIAYDLEIEI